MLGEVPRTELAWDLRRKVVCAPLLVGTIAAGLISSLAMMESRALQAEAGLAVFALLGIAAYIQLVGKPPSAS